MLIRILTPIVLAAIIFIVIGQQKMDLLNNPNIAIELFSDNYENGKSKIFLINKTSDELKYKFKLQEGFKYPYAGVSLKNNTKKLLDIKNYDILEIEISSNNEIELVVNFYNFVKGFTKIDDFSSYYPLFTNIISNKINNSIPINLNKLNQKHWWLDEHKNFNSSIPDLSSLIYFEITNSESQNFGIEEVVTISKLQLKKDSKKILLSLIISVVFYFILLFLFYLVKSRLFKKLKIVSYKSLDIKDDNSKDNKIELFISEHYMNPELCITMISDSLGISGKQVSEGINRKYNISFPNYLNLIRINESKRLLKETNKKVIDIAIEVGYNTPVHFNRIFKKQENLTPREYRKKWENH